MERARSASFGLLHSRKAQAPAMLGASPKADDIVTRFGLAYGPAADPISDEAKVALALLKTRHIC